MSIGISPLVATVLLIAVTMTIAGILAYWASTFVSGTLPPTDCTSASFTVISKQTTGGKLFLTLQNTGKIDLTITNITLIYSDGTVDVRSPNKVMPAGQVTTLSLDSVTSGYINCIISTNCPDKYQSCM